jgi:hypothetical protein
MMNPSWKTRLVMLAALVFIFWAMVWAEDFTISTYYPAPSGAFNLLTVNQLMLLTQPGTYRDLNVDILQKAYKYDQDLDQRITNIADKNKEMLIAISDMLGEIKNTYPTDVNDPYYDDGIIKIQDSHEIISRYATALKNSGSGVSGASTRPAWWP